MSRLGLQYALTALKLIELNAREGEAPDAGVLASFNAGLAAIVNEPRDSEMLAFGNLISQLYTDTSTVPALAEDAAAPVGGLPEAPEAGAAPEAPSASSVVLAEGAEAPTAGEMPLPQEG